MKVTLWAHTVITDALRERLPQQDEASDADHLHEAAGRSCFQSWSRPRPETAATGNYLANIIDQNHLSVLSHGAATFYIEGVSRACTHELIRHRWISISELSQRYCDVGGTWAVVPPALAGNDAALPELHDAYRYAVECYDTLIQTLESQGLDRKRAREAARAVMPNATPTAIVVSANYRAWRDLLRQRLAPGADREIRALAVELLRQLYPLAPATFQDIAAEYDSGAGTEVAS